MIQLIDVHKAYQSLTALRGVSLTVREGECAVLIGPSGCGKSTLLKSINRMVEIDQGQILVNGKNVRDYQLEELRLHTGYCIQGVGLFPHFTVQENIALVPGLLKWAPDRISQRVRYLMDLTGLPLSYLGKKPRELSGGEAQRVGVCRALAADPPILLMDEPFGSVDPLNRERLQMSFVRLQKELKKTVIFVTHDVEEALMIGDRIFIMNQGRVEAAGTPGHFSGKLEQGFARDFLGNEYPLKILKKYTVRDLNPAGLQTVSAADTAEAAEISEMQLLRGDDISLKQVLSEMMRRNEQTLHVLVAGDRILSIQYSDLVRHLHEVAEE
jgi:osmoprotectant transport system ATP-binding protein